jgi:hypothetical protein
MESPDGRTPEDGTSSPKRLKERRRVLPDRKGVVSFAMLLWFFLSEARRKDAEERRRAWDGLVDDKDGTLSCSWKSAPGGKWHCKTTTLAKHNTTMISLHRQLRRLLSPTLARASISLLPTSKYYGVTASILHRWTHTHANYPNSNTALFQRRQMTTAYGGTPSDGKHNAHLLTHLIPYQSTLSDGRRVEVDFFRHSSTEIEEDEWFAGLALMNLIIREGRSWPFEEEFSSVEQYSGYFLSHTAFVVRALNNGMDASKRNSSSKGEILGCFYIKPNFPGRCSHICNGGKSFQLVTFDHRSHYIMIFVRLHCGSSFQRIGCRKADGQCVLASISRFGVQV